MSLSSDIVSQIFSLPAQDRFELANHLLDSIDQREACSLGGDFTAELHRRREEMLRGEEIVPDWRAALAEIENTVRTESKE